MEAQQIEGRDPRVIEEPQARFLSRPLGSFSAFVVEQLPSAVMQVIDSAVPIRSLEERVRAAVARAEPEGHFEELKGRPQGEKKLALLDLLVCVNAIHALGGKPPEPLTAHVDAVAADIKQLPWLTYDLIVRTNPAQEPRSFTGLESEKEFYSRHERVEREMSFVLGSMQRIANHLDQKFGSSASAGGCDDIAPHIDAIRSRLSTVEVELSWFAALSAEDFKKFRIFFYEDSGRPGPSGLFSAHMQAYSIALAGNQLGRSLGRVVQLMEYYPSDDRHLLDWALDRANSGKSFFEIANSGSVHQDEREKLVELFEAEKRILAIHRGIIRKNLAAEFAANAPGTGGRPIRSFIDGTLDLYSSLIAQLTGKGGDSLISG